MDMLIFFESYRWKVSSCATSNINCPINVTTERRYPLSPNMSLLIKL